jgi:hypothetical protein
MQYGIEDEDIFNFDETGFATGVMLGSRIITSSEISGNPHLLQPWIREWVKTIECINASGWVIPSTIIFKGSVHIEGCYQESRYQVIGGLKSVGMVGQAMR